MCGQVQQYGQARQGRFLGVGGEEVLRVGAEEGTLVLFRPGGKARDPRTVERGEGGLGQQRENTDEGVHQPRVATREETEPGQNELVHPLRITPCKGMRDAGTEGMAENARGRDCLGVEYRRDPCHEFGHGPQRGVRGGDDAETGFEGGDRAERGIAEGEAAAQDEKRRPGFPGCGGNVRGLRGCGSRDVLPFDAADCQRPVRVGGAEGPQPGIPVHGSSRRMA